MASHENDLTLVTQVVKTVLQPFAQSQQVDESINRCLKTIKPPSNASMELINLFLTYAVVDLNLSCNDVLMEQRIRIFETLDSSGPTRKKLAKQFADKIKREIRDDGSTVSSEKAKPTSRGFWFRKP